MARAISMDPLGFHNISLGSDSMKIKYDDSKADMAGERLSEKNIYTNPFDWQLCWWTLFGIYCAINVDQLTRHEKLFHKQGSKEGVYAQSYQEQLLDAIKENSDEVKIHMRLDHANACGI